MTEAIAKYWDPGSFDGCLKRLDCWHTMSRIARPVTDKYAVEVMCYQVDWEIPGKTRGFVIGVSNLATQEPHLTRLEWASVISEC